MADRPKPRQRGTAIAIGALLVGWIAVVVIGAGRRPEDPARLGVDNLGLVIFGVIVFCALVGLVLLIYLQPAPGHGFTRPERSRRPWALMAAIFVLFAIWGPDVLSALRELTGEEDTERQGEVEAQVEAVDFEPVDPPVAQLTDVLAVVAIVVVIAGVVAYVRYRSTEAAVEFADEDPTTEQLRSELAEALDDAVVELSDNGDPRVAVMNAYLGLERVLRSRGLGRMRSETAAEHLRRAVSNLRVDPAPLEELGHLYELARFSNQDIFPAQRDRARRALEHARTDMATTS